MNDELAEKPHELTEQEVRERFLDHCWESIEFWSKQPDKTVRERLSGVVFSVLVSLDGGSMGLPGFIVAPDPHPDDKKYNRENGDDWFPQNIKAKVACDIAGCLHEYFHKHDPMRGNK